MSGAIFTDEQEKYIQHEVEIRVLRSDFLSLKEELVKLDLKIDKKTNQVVGVILGGFFLSVFLKLIGVF